ncbi:MAG TPA: DUF1304 domain-containing protein [Candidatus Xenobia bacterium]|jgi:putative membrane protein
MLYTILPVLSSALIVICALEHVWFAILEGFLWRKPVGLRVFKMEAEKANATWQLAANQGAYNAIFALGLLYGLFAQDLVVSHAFKFFFLIAIVIAGVVGGLTVNSRIMYIQALPAALAMVILFIAESNS